MVLRWPYASYAGVVANDSPQGGAPKGRNAIIKTHQAVMITPRVTRTACDAAVVIVATNARAMAGMCHAPQSGTVTITLTIIPVIKGLKGRNKGRTANYGRNRQSNNRGNSRNRYHQSDSASEFMEKMFEFFQNR